MAIPQNIVRADQATVRGRVGWASQSGAVGRREPFRCFEQATYNGGCADIDTVGVAGRTTEVTRQISSTWVDVELAKLYTGIGQSNSTLASPR